VKDEFVSAATEWLGKIQNKDGGWGMYDYDPSRIVTTAEAVTALAIVGSHRDPMEMGADYLIRSANNPAWCQYHRHHAWTVYALARAGYRDQIPMRCIQALQRSHMKGGWGHALGEAPNIFPTFLGWRALNQYGKSKRLLKQTCDWLIRHFENNYWTFEDRKPSYAATSYAILALTSYVEFKEQYSHIINKAVKYLLTGGGYYWPNEYESKVSGDLLYNFHHFTLPWAIMALISAGISPSDITINPAVAQLYNKHFWLPTGGWAEEVNHRPSVFGTSHTIAALEMIYQSFNINEYLQLQQSTRVSQINHNNVFIVHGHDTSSKLEVARFLEKINCNPIILEEQVESGSKTIFDKFTEHAEKVSYAIVLMTPDDIIDSAGSLKRARQNVVLELGFFVGKLGANKVCVAKKANVEIPSDISGVLYLNLDDGGWRLLLAQKLHSAGLDIDLAKLITQGKSDG